MSEHHYLSTACLHARDNDVSGYTPEQLHEYCQRDTGFTGVKTPAVCKFCRNPCQCLCHVEVRRGPAWG